jgi:ABC-type lipoprotein release transport system permease subunit
MGLPAMELTVTATEELRDETVADIEDTISKYTEIEKKYYYSFVYMSLNGDEYACVVYKNPESIIMSEGRYPQYDNEIAVTDFLAKELNLKTGDKVTVSSKNIAAEYIITGIHVYAANSGLTFAMPLEGAKKLDVQDVLFYGFSLKDTSECFDIADELNEKYSDILTAVGVEEDPNLAMYSVAREAMTAIIYIISVLFSLIVVLMVCKKAFLQEKRDIGIYKALGFTSSKLRLQFAVRFLIVSLIGSAFGSLLSVLFTQNVLTAVFSFAGISSFNTEFTAVSFMVPVAIIAVSFFVFSYLASSKIKTVEIKDLVVE